MSFRDNLQHLRATRNMTQEQLAMLVGVSRQSVTKWEAERAYPEMDKLIKLTQIFDCTLDELVSGDLTGREVEPAQAVPAQAALADVCGYDEHKRSVALRIAAGVGVIILGIAIAALTEGLAPQPFNQDTFSAIAAFAGIGIGLGLLLPAAFADDAFSKAHPFIEDFYTSEEKEKVRRRFGTEIALGIGAVLAGVAVGAIHDSRIFHAAFLALVALGVFIIVRAALTVGRIDVEDYNVSALSELTEEEVASIVGEERAPAVLAKVRRNRKLGLICGIIMLIASIVGLCLMFWGMYEQNFFQQYFWLAWCVGGLLCAIASAVLNLRQK